MGLILFPRNIWSKLKSKIWIFFSLRKFQQDEEQKVLRKPSFGSWWAALRLMLNLEPLIGLFFIRFPPFFIFFLLDSKFLFKSVLSLQAKQNIFWADFVQYPQLMMKKLNMNANYINAEVLCSILNTNQKVLLGKLHKHACCTFLYFLN